MEAQLAAYPCDDHTMARGRHWLSAHEGEGQDGCDRTGDEHRRRDRRTGGTALPLVELFAGVADVFLRGHFDELERVLSGGFPTTGADVLEVTVDVARKLAAKTLLLPGVVEPMVSLLFTEDFSDDVEVVSLLAALAAGTGQLLQAGKVLHQASYTIRIGVSWQRPQHSCDKKN